MAFFLLSQAWAGWRQAQYLKMEASRSNACPAGRRAARQRKTSSPVDALALRRGTARTSELLHPLLQTRSTAGRAVVLNSARKPISSTALATDSPAAWGRFAPGVFLQCLRIFGSEKKEKSPATKLLMPEASCFASSSFMCSRAYSQTRSGLLALTSDKREEVSCATRRTIRP